VQVQKPLQFLRSTFSIKTLTPINDKSVEIPTEFPRRLDLLLDCTLVPFDKLETLLNCRYPLNVRE
jgi:hypothetical protein